jgi:hypothetical protein
VVVGSFPKKNNHHINHNNMITIISSIYYFIFHVIAINKYKARLHCMLVISVIKYGVFVIALCVPLQ